ncbi:unnamed protein product, partial [Brassica oleracea]
SWKVPQAFHLYSRSCLKRISKVPCCTSLMLTLQSAWRELKELNKVLKILRTKESINAPSSLLISAKGKGWFFAILRMVKLLSLSHRREVNKPASWVRLLLLKKLRGLNLVLLLHSLCTLRVLQALVWGHPVSLLLTPGPTVKKKQRNRPPAWKRRLRTTTVPSKLTLDDNPEDSGDSRTKRKATDPACEGSKK